MNNAAWMWKQRSYRAPEGDDGSSNGGAPGASPETDNGDGPDWASLNDDVPLGADEGGGSDDDSGVDASPTPSTQPVETPEEKPEPEATTPDPAAPKPVTPVQEEAPVKTPEEQAAESAALTKRFEEWRQSEEKRLTGEYQFDEDTAARLQTEPELVLPELAAKMHMQVMQQVVETVQRMMPSMVQPVLQNTTREAEAATFFTSHNSDLNLNDAATRSAIQEAGIAFRKMNPKATPEEAAKGIGQMVRVARGLPTPPPAVKEKASPHRPAAAGARGSSASSKPAANQWSELLDED